MSKQIDFTTTDPDGFVTGLYLKKYDDGEALVKIFFVNNDPHTDESVQDEVEFWFIGDETDQLKDFLNGDDND